MFIDNNIYIQELQTVYYMAIMAIIIIMAIMACGNSFSGILSTFTGIWKPSGRYDQNRHVVIFRLHQRFLLC